MTTENTESLSAPLTAPATPPAEQNAAPVEKEAAESDPATPKDEKQETEKPPQAPQEIPRGVQRRIDRAIAQRAEARAQAEIALRQVEELKAKLNELQPAEPQESQQRQDDPHEIARRLVQEQSFNVKSNEVFEQGSKAFKDFDSKLEQLRTLALEPAERRQFLETVLDCEKPAEVLYYLGAHPDEAADLVSMSERQQVRALAKLEMQLANAPKMSSAPAPIKPIGNRGGAPNGDPSNMSQKEYEAWRAKNGASWARHNPT
jgi:hypothetical protein